MKRTALPGPLPARAWQGEGLAARCASSGLPLLMRVRVYGANQDRGRGAGFIPQEREHRTDAPAKFQSFVRSQTPLRTEVRAPSLHRSSHAEQIQSPVLMRRTRYAPAAA